MSSFYIPVWSVRRFFQAGAFYILIPFVFLHLGLFYTQQDIREIVAYATARGICIIPEIEVPGHVSASVYAYPWVGASSKKTGKLVPGDLYDVTDPKVTQFLHDVLDEIISLFPGGIIHIGGDEANYAHWQQSETINAFMQKEEIPTYADLQAWAINRLSTYISSKGYQMIGWNEITGDNVRGEFTPTKERLYYQIFPRLAAYAVVGWADPEQKPTYEQFIQNFKAIEDVWKEKGYLKDQPYQH